MKNKDIDEIFFLFKLHNSWLFEKKNHSIKSPSASTTALILCMTREQARVTLYKAWQWKRTNEYFQPLITSIKVHQFSKVIHVLKSAHPQLFVGGVYFYFLLHFFMRDSWWSKFLAAVFLQKLTSELSSIKVRNGGSINKHYQ